MTIRIVSHSASEEFDQLRKTFRGDLITPADASYDAARRVWNGAVDRRPALIAFCADADDVAAAVKFARVNDRLVAVRSGGHNVAGLSVCDGGVVIDLSRLKAIEIDRDKRIARAGAGLKLGEFDRATQMHGLATTMGVNSDTGIAGLTLGGGFGRLGRKFGLTCDNLLAVELVTAEGRHVRASASENPELFWGLRGGGGNFGIATAFEYRLHDIGRELTAASALHRYSDAAEAMRWYDSFARNAPDEVSVDAALITTPSGEAFFNVSACHVGDVDEGERLLSPVVQYGAPVEMKLGRIPYLEIQSGGDELFPVGRRYYWKAQFLREISAPAIEAMLAGYMRPHSAWSLLVFQHVGGAISRVPPSGTAYANRDAAFDCFPVAIWDDPREDAANVEWARRLWSDIAPYSTGGVYSNNLGDEGEERVHAAYGGNYTRLAALKARYDPTNFFRLNQNIRTHTV